MRLVLHKVPCPSSVVMVLLSALPVASVRARHRRTARRGREHPDRRSGLLLRGTHLPALARDATAPNILGLSELRLRGQRRGDRAVPRRRVDIGATDAPLRPEEAAEGAGSGRADPGHRRHDRHCLQSARGRWSSESAEGRLPRYLSGHDLALGRSTDRRCESGVALPAKLIQVVARQDSSGTTFAFTNHLAAISADWAAGPVSASCSTGRAGRWSRAETRGSPGGSRSTEGSIGYVEAGFAERLRLPLAWFENRAGGYRRTQGGDGPAGLAGGSDAIPEDLVRGDHRS